VIKCHQVWPTLAVATQKPVSKQVSPSDVLAISEAAAILAASTVTPSSAA